MCVISTMTREWFGNGSRMVRQMCAVRAILRGKCVNCLKSLKSLMQIFATYATYASAIFVGKESNESTVRYALWSRISLTKPLQNPYLTLTRFRLSLGSAVSRFSLASLICLCMLTIGVGNAWGETLVLTFNGSTNAYSLVTNSSSSENTFTQGTITLGYKSCKDASYSSVHYIQFDKGAGVLYNKTALPGSITKIKVEYRNGTSEKSDLGVKCGTSKIDTRQTSSLNATLDTKSNGADSCSLDAANKYTFFNLSVQGGTNKNYGNIQVIRITITYSAAASNVTLHWATNGSGGTSTSSQAQSATLPEKSDLDCGWDFIGWMPNEYTGKSSSGMINAGQTAGSNTNLYALYSHPTYGSTNSLSTSPRIYTVTQSNSNATESTYNYDCVSNVETDIVNYYGATSGYALSATTPTVTVGGVAVDPSNIMWDITGTYGDGPSYPGYLWISLDEYFGGNVVINVATELVCSNSVTIATGSPTNCTISTSAASVSTCSSTESDRYVTVSVQPNTCYAAPVKASVTSSGTTAAWVSGPTLNAGHYDYVYSFAENATGTTTFSCSLSTKTTYTVQYNAGATTCTGGNAITGSHADDTKTCGTNMTLPGETFHTTGYTQTGWTKSSCGSQTNGLGGSYTSNAAQTFYPVWTANSYTVTWMVNGVAYSAGGSTSVNYGSHVETLPTAPTPPCGNKFMGWTTTNIGSVGQATDAGLNLFTTAGGAPIISAEGPVTYYAVFADYAE